MNINIEAIIASKSNNIQTKLSAGYKLGGKETLTLTEAKLAIKEIVEAVIGKCAEEARIHQIGLYGSANRFEIDNGEITIVADKDSILNVKEMIDYS